MIPLTFLQIMCAVTVLSSMHYIFDFKLQTHEQASNKSKCNKALSSHVAVYTAGLLLMAVFLIVTQNKPQSVWIGWVLVNASLHWCTDWVTSRLSSAKWARQEWHDFFEVIGADQLIHHMTLFWTFYLAMTS